jgi:hypothetical protein
MNRTKILAMVGAAGALAVALGVYVVVARRGAARPSRPVPTDEQRAYLTHIVVTDARMSAAENFAGSSMTYLKARVTNRGAKLVRGLEIQMEFHDTLEQVVLRDQAHPISPRTPPLKPGETRDFQVSFEHMPADWNRTPPTISATNVEF